VGATATEKNSMMPTLAASIRSLICVSIVVCSAIGVRLRRFCCGDSAASSYHLSSTGIKRWRGGQLLKAVPCGIVFQAGHGVQRR
jgi:hypothetical protein